MRAAQGKALAILLSLSAWDAQAQSAAIQSNIQGQVGSFTELFAGQKFFPGQKVLLVISGQVDVNHEYWEDRRCNWLGLNCWYEKRDRPYFFGPDAYPAVVRPERGDAVVSPELTGDPKLEASGASFMPFKSGSPQQIEFTVVRQEADSKLAIFGTGVTFEGKIADTGPRGAVTRVGCVSRITCSGGQYSVSVASIDNAGRLDLLSSILRTKRSAAEIVQSLDRQFIEDEAVKEKIAVALFRHSQSLHAAPEPTADYIALLEYASNLFPSALSGEVGNKLSLAYLKSGNISLARDKAGSDHDRLAKSFEQNPKDPNARREYATNLRILGQIRLRERNGMVSSDLTRAISLFIDSSKIAAEGAENQALSRTDRKLLYILAKESLIDCTRALMMLKTPVNLAKAENIATRAIEFAKLAASMQ